MFSILFYSFIIFSDWKEEKITLKLTISCT